MYKKYGFSGKSKVYDFSKSQCQIESEVLLTTFHTRKTFSGVLKNIVLKQNLKQLDMAKLLRNFTKYSNIASLTSASKIIQMDH